MGHLSDRWTSGLAQKVRRFSYPKIMNEIYGCGADCLSETLREDPTGSSAHRLPGNLLYGRLADDRRRCPLRGIDWGLSATAAGRRTGQKGSAQEIYDALGHQRPSDCDVVLPIP
ncbi:uncharacterized protein METZ01_LOCUS232154 [marine metagenome]|uniref:Uncharacterized protein n=1 Tax=marine metagenome TaxID=408172 RepID=A0A382GW75_9ZZZZ